MRILIAQAGHETNTFSSVKAEEEGFKRHQNNWLRGQEITAHRDGSTDYLSGMISKARELGAEVLPVFATFYGGGVITKECYQSIKRELLPEIEKAKNDIDGICLSLHGAGVVEGIDDMERDLMVEIRRIVGDDMPITASFDLHGNLSEEMTRLLNGVVSIREYPHVDAHIAGAKAMEILIRTIRKEIDPKLSYIRIPLMTTPASAYTQSGPAKEINDYLDKTCSELGLLYISYLHGFPYADIPCACTSIIVNADGDQELAERVALDAARFVWNMRQRFDQNHLSPKEALEKALSLPGKPIVINDTADNPGGGSPADGTHLLREMIRRNPENVCFGFIYDPQFVELATRAGVGNTFSGLLGGKTDKIHGEPIQVENAYVKCLTDGVFIASTPVMFQGCEVSTGKSARVTIGNVDVIVGSVRNQTFDDRLFALHGIDVRDYKVVALKSTHHFRGIFQDIASEIITADSPGIVTSNFSLLEYRHIKRPIYPLDKEMPSPF